MPLPPLWDPFRNGPQNGVTGRMLTPKERLVILHVGPESVSTIDLEQAASWRNGTAWFDGAALADVVEGECPELCVSGLAHAGFRYGHALKRYSNMIAN
jgi:hypothetical protein